MAVSTNSVIHYTKTLENIKGILTSGFKLKYCVEGINFHNESNFNIAFAMVCFCDIPLSEIKEHLDSYGYYGIGLSKQWAKRKKLNPVLYIESNSNIAESINRQVTEILSSKTKLSFKWLDSLFETFAYLKNYDGELYRGDQRIENYKFYNEREWRYVPNISELNGLPFDVRADDYLENKDEYNSKLKDIYLKFEPSDISYILVKKEEEIIDVIKHLRAIYSDKCTATQLETLLTRIVSIESIINDF